jgi:hypothetical protein
MLSKKYVVLNTLLFLLIILLVFENYETRNGFMGWLPDKDGVPKKAEIINEDPLVADSPGAAAAVESLNLIAAKNIFSDERKDFPALSNSQQEKGKPNVRPQVLLYGVAIAGDYESATVVNPGRPLRKGESEALILKKGEKIGDYKLAKILPDRIAMEGNGDTFEVLLHDSKKKNMEARTEAKLAMIASPQPPPIIPSTEAPKPNLSQESVKESKAPVQSQAVPSLPFNKYTYQQFLSSSTGIPAIRRGRIPLIPRGSLPQEPGQK